MTYKTLGHTGLKVSMLCLGTMNYGGKGFFSHMGNLGQQEVDEQIKTVVEAGVNFIDTANIVICCVRLPGKMRNSIYIINSSKKRKKNY